MNKNAQLGEIPTVISLIFIVLVAGIVITYILGFFVDAFSGLGDNAQTSVDILNTGITNYRDGVDGTAVALAGLMFVVAIVLIFILPIHPIFFVVGLIALFFLVPWAGIVRDTFIAITNETVLNTTAVQFSNANLVMLNMPLMACLADILFLVGLFVKGVFTSG